MADCMSGSTSLRVSIATHTNQTCHLLQQASIVPYSLHRSYKGQAFPPTAALLKGEGKNNFSQPQDNMREESKKGWHGMNSIKNIRNFLSESTRSRSRRRFNQHYEFLTAEVKKHCCALLKVDMHHLSYTKYSSLTSS